MLKQQFNGPSNSNLNEFILNMCLVSLVFTSFNRFLTSMPVKFIFTEDTFYLDGD